MAVNLLHVVSEKEILSEASCDFIVKLHKTFQDNKHVYLVSISHIAIRLFKWP
jgi:hypothetical protein